MKITKEIEIDLSDLSDRELVELLEDRISYAGCLLTDDAKKLLSPHQQEMCDKLTEVYLFLQRPQSAFTEEDKDKLKSIKLQL